MAGMIKQTIDRIITQRCKGNSVVARSLRIKMILKGVDPDKYHSESPDDPEVLSRLREIAMELGVAL